MDNGAKKQKLTKIALIVFVIVVAFFLGLILYSRRPQRVGKGKTSVADFNSRIDYHDEMNCVVGEKNNNDNLVISATDGWANALIENYDLANEKVTIRIADDKYYVDAPSGKKIYNLEYFNYEYKIDFFESLKLSDDDARPINCYAQDSSKYVLKNPREYEDYSMRKVEDEEEQEQE